MATYSIKDLEFLSGIKAHTIRIWEQRYGLLTPDRTKTNIRTYSEDNIKHFLNIALLYNKGYKISKLAKLNPEEINEEVLKISEKKFDKANQLTELTLSMVDLDEDRFEKIVSTHILQYGFEKCMQNLILPFLHKTGILWQTNAINPAQEHFTSNLIRQKLIVAIDGQITNYEQGSKKYLLFLPEGEMHELGLLFACFLIKARNNKVIYLGANVPFDDVIEIFNFHNPHFLVTSFTLPHTKEESIEYITKLSDTFNKTTIFVGGHHMMTKSVETKLPNVIILYNFNDLISFIEKNKTQPVQSG